MTKYLKVLVLVIVFSACDCAELCQVCTSTDTSSSCRYGSTAAVDPNKECPSGMSKCFRLSYILKCNGTQIFQRGCTTADFCNKQYQRQDIDIRLCQICDKDYCNTGTLLVA
ncbi:hypothetical protein WA026_001823 [Henosepilachna vigintioctopunctata]|uniref:Uncharacterized protein n=1 Tax=Henosepilachna vigintioctopunctata TaxID=420089 RepID=A0AAW1USZ5_9CUCU